MQSDASRRTRRAVILSGSRSPQNEHGQDLVEFALIAPIVILLILGILQFGIIMMQYNTVANAAREGARYAIVNRATMGSGNCGSPGAAGSVLAQTCNWTVGLEASKVTVVTQACSGATALGCIQVTVQYRAELIIAPLIPGLGSSGPLTLVLGAASSMQREQEP